jgi:hypothetical protein
MVMLLEVVGWPLEVFLAVFVSVSHFRRSLEKETYLPSFSQIFSEGLNLGYTELTHELVGNFTHAQSQPLSPSSKTCFLASYT